MSTYDTVDGVVHALPGGGQRRGETLDESLVREIHEEAGLDITVGRMRWIREFIPARLPVSSFDPSFHQVEIIFECTAHGDAEPRLGAAPDPGQVGVGWLPVHDLVNAPFFPQEIARILNGQASDRTYLGDT